MKQLFSRRNLIGSASFLAAAATVGTGKSIASDASRSLASPASPATIPHSEEFLLQGPRDRTYKIQVAQPFPDDPSLTLPVKGRKPVPIYVLDGGTTFGLVTSLTRFMRWGGELPPCLVVGIDYADWQEGYDKDYRRYDLTPPDPDWTGWSNEKTEMAKDVGGEAEFRRFLTGTVRPLIEEKYEADRPASVLYGHSLGGLFALNTMMEAPGAFSNILALSPSLWFAKHRFLQDLEQKIESSFRYSGNLATYVGEREERIAGVEYKMVSNVLELDALLTKNQSNFGRADISVLPGESHHSLHGIAISRGLRFLIGTYPG